MAGTGDPVRDYLGGTRESTTRVRWPFRVREDCRKSRRVAETDLAATRTRTYYRTGVGQWTKSKSTHATTVKGRTGV